MADTTYTTDLDVEQVYDIMAQHAKVSMEANELAFERMFDSDDKDTEARLEATQRELDLVTQANSLAFRAASAFMTPEFVAEFQDYWAARSTES